MTQAMMDATVEGLQGDLAAQAGWKWGRAGGQVDSQEGADKLWGGILLLFSVKEIDAVEGKMRCWKKSMEEKK